MADEAQGEVFGYWMNPAGEYHEGLQSPGDVAVPKMPGLDYMWDAATSSWLPDPDWTPREIAPVVVFGYWMSVEGDYHEGHRFPGDVAVPQRPDQFHVWDQATSSWLEDLVRLKAIARTRISEAAETARLQFVTPGSAKAMAYQEKAKEAADFLAAATAEQPVSAELFPLIFAEVGSTAETAAEVAAIVAGLYNAFKLIEAQIGGAEAAAQKAVREADTRAAIDAVLDGLTWPQSE